MSIVNCQLHGWSIIIMEDIDDIMFSWICCDHPRCFSMAMLSAPSRPSWAILIGYAGLWFWWCFFVGKLSILNIAFSLSTVFTVPRMRCYKGKHRALAMMALTAFVLKVPWHALTNLSQLIPALNTDSLPATCLEILLWGSWSWSAGLWQQLGGVWEDPRCPLGVPDVVWRQASGIWATCLICWSLITTDIKS